MKIVVFVAVLMMLPGSALAAEGSQPFLFATAPLSILWILANFSYAGMRAQASNRYEWRAISFVGGFPGTLVSMAVVSEGGQRLYGVDIPRRRSQ